MSICQSSSFQSSNHPHFVTPPPHKLTVPSFSSKPRGFVSLASTSKVPSLVTPDEKNSESQTSNHITLQSQIIQLVFLSDSNFNCKNHDFRSKPSGTRRAKVIRALASTPPLPNSKLCLGRNFRNSAEKSGQPKMKLWDWKSQHSILISPACWFSSYYECKYTRWIEKNKRSNPNEEDTQWSMYVHQKGLSGISWKCQMFQDCLGELCSSFDGE